MIQMLSCRSCMSNSTGFVEHKNSSSGSQPFLANKKQSALAKKGPFTKANKSSSILKFELTWGFSFLGHRGQICYRHAYFKVGALVFSRLFIVRSSENVLLAALFELNDGCLFSCITHRHIYEPIYTRPITFKFTKKIFAINLQNTNRQ